MKAWDVLINGTFVDAVFYHPSFDAETVRRSLIDHDGYPDNITVIERTSVTTQQ